MWTAPLYESETDRRTIVCIVSRTNEKEIVGALNAFPPVLNSIDRMCTSSFLVFLFPLPNSLVFATCFWRCPLLVTWRLCAPVRARFPARTSTFCCKLQSCSEPQVCDALSSRLSRPSLLLLAPTCSTDINAGHTNPEDQDELILCAGHLHHGHPLPHPHPSSPVSRHFFNWKIPGPTHKLGAQPTSIRRII